MITGLFAKILLAIIMGAVIGLERENSSHNGESNVGIRTYSLVALVGALSGIFILNNLPFLAYLIFGGIFVLFVSYYVVGSYISRDVGFTSEISMVVTFILGMMFVLDIVPLQIIIATFVLLILILSLKTTTKKIVSGISSSEPQSFISYAIIALVVLPFLPDINYRLADIPVLPDILRGLSVDMGKFANLDLINFRNIWLVVVLITGIDVFGYVLSRLVGSKKGFALTSFVAGFISSTSATQSLAQRSKKSNFVNHLVGAAILANLASFLQIFLLVAPLNIKWIIYIFPSILCMIIAAGIASLVFFNRKEPKDIKDNPQANKSTKIFSLMPALKFVAILIVIKIITKVCLILFGNSGFVVSSIIASFVGIDAILVNLAEMAGQTITFKFALLTFLLVNATNLLSKTIYSFVQGHRSFALKFFGSVISIIGVSWIWMIFV